MKNLFPVINYSGVPISKHPGAFKACRKFDIHTGVDIYTQNREPVYAIRDGVVVSKGVFTGIKMDSPWWNETFYLAIKSGELIFLYGEIEEVNFKIGDLIKRGQEISKVKQVLPDHKLRSDIEGHSTSMLHLELYNLHANFNPVEWPLSEEKPKFLLDPTTFLLTAAGFNGKVLT